MEIVIFFILNVIINSFLTFFTVAFLIEAVIFLFRIRPGRTAAYLRIVPFLKLPLDLFLYNFSSWSFLQGVNPLLCEKQTRTLSVLFGQFCSTNNWWILPLDSGIRFTVHDCLTFTLADLIGYTLEPFWLRFGILLFLSLGSFFILRKTFHYCQASHALRNLTSSSKPILKKLRNSHLTKWINKSGIPIQTSSFLSGSPFVSGLLSSKVYFPQALLKLLSNQEYAAVLAHEIEHVRHKDSLTRLSLDVIQTLFWWIPTQWLRKQIEEGQEIGCDQKCTSYGIHSTILASALCKSVKFATTTSHSPHFVHYFTRHPLLKRINLSLDPPSHRLKKRHCLLTFIAVGMSFGMIFLGRFWIF